ncbi:MAG: hypothetical protein QME81_11905 [bacterium]|nr:hypothetical protein [bacterium]
MKRNNGLTLIEFLSIVAIVGLLILILIPSWRWVTDGASESATKANIRQLRTAIQKYYLDYTEFPKTLDSVPDAGKKPFVTSYIKERPEALLKKSLGAVSQSDAIKYGIEPAAGTTDGGWFYNPTTGQIWVNHSAMDSKGELSYLDY